MDPFSDVAEENPKWMRIDAFKVKLLLSVCRFEVVTRWEHLMSMESGRNYEFEVVQFMIQRS